MSESKTEQSKENYTKDIKGNVSMKKCENLPWPLSCFTSKSDTLDSNSIFTKRQSSIQIVSSKHSSELSRWDFDSSIENDPIRQFDTLQTIFGSMQAHDLFQISFEGFQSFLEEMKAGYMEIPGLHFQRYYHNFAHALDVTQTTFALFHYMDQGNMTMTRLEQVVLLVAALGHDIRHPGVSNHFVTISKHSLILEYGDHLDGSYGMPMKVCGVLERMHAAETRQLVSKYDLLASQPSEIRMEMEKLIMISILNTDMCQHDGLLKYMNGIALREGSPPLSSEEKMMLSSFFLHCADLSNAAKPWNTAERWAKLVMKEFFEQGEAERIQGMPISPNCDAMTTMVPELQIKFIQFAVLPCFVLFQSLYPRAIEPVNCSMSNIREWEYKKEFGLSLEQREIIRVISTIKNAKKKTIKINSNKKKSTKIENPIANTILHYPIYLFLFFFISIFIIFEPYLHHYQLFHIENWPHITQWIGLIFCIIDMILSTLGDARYFNGIYFWLDFLSIISLAIEILFPFHWIYYDFFPIFFQPRMVRLGRLVRMMHQIPFHSCFFERKIETKSYSYHQNEDFNLMFQRRDINKLFQRFSKSNQFLHSQAIEELVDEAYNGCFIPKDAISNILSYFNSIDLKNNFISFDIFANGIHQMELKHNGSIEITPEYTDDHGKIMVGQELSDIVVKRILIIVLFVLLCVPRLEFDQPEGITKYQYSILHAHQFAITKASNATYRADDFRYIWNDLNAIYLDIYKIIPNELNDIIMSNASELYYYSERCHIDRHIICIEISDYETYMIVIKPIESMLNIVRQLAINPAIKIQVQPGESNNEILQLQNTLVKIASLIQIGFGQAGAEILAGNMQEGDLNPMAHGKYVHGIFGFCSIRDFSIATEILKEDIMQYINQISEVVHESVHVYGGQANKNIGPAFFLVWKIPSTSIDVSLVNSSQIPQHMSPKKSNFLRVMELPNATRKFLTVADKALISFLRIQLDISNSFHFEKYKKILNLLNLKNNNSMGFGLHVGWAIEGAIGSRYKIDASYLSPDVNISARLEAATKQFGVNILISHTFHKLLSKQVQDLCRLIDCVTVKGSEKPLSLYTFDISPSFEYNNNINLSLFEHLKELQNGIPNEFYILFNNGVNKYFDGKWNESKIDIKNALKLIPNDGPSLLLLKIMKKNNYISPLNWNGFRILNEK